MHGKAKYADVFVGYPVEGSYTYSIPDDMIIMPGMRVIVDFGNKIVTAFVHRTHNEKPDFDGIKEINEKIDTSPVFDGRLVSLAEYIAGNYICTTGEVLAMALPSGRRPSDKFKHPFKNRNLSLKKIELNQAQKDIYNNIINSYKAKELNHLIFGITGSGKTEIYMEIAKYIISLGRSVIYLVPEITLSSQIFERLYNVFGDDLVVYHSQLTENQRLHSWMRFYSGDAKIAVGTRSASFLQCPELGLVIIDEEHDLSYKEHSTPRYHTKRIVYHRCSTENAIMLMGSATPSVESLYTAEQGAVKLHLLKDRFGEASLPEIEIVRIDSKKGKDMLSPKLVLHTKRALTNGNQAIFLLNRRGFAPIVKCGNCGEIIKCPHCNISLNFHRSGRLICHYCGYSRFVPSECPECGAGDLLKLGAGTQQIEEIINKSFTGYRVFRLDQDSAKKKYMIFDVVEKMAKGEIDILVGTQMVAKGFDFHNVSIVGVLLADIGLNMPDFRASERIFSLLIQVAGRCGRGEVKGKVIIQTMDETQHILGFLQKHDYMGFYKSELATRRLLQYPPFSRLARLLIRGRNEEKVIKNINLLKDILEKEIKGKEVILLGPVAAPFPKISNNFRYHIILKSKYIEQIRQVVISAKKMITGKDVYLEIDIDPFDIL